MHFDCVFLLIDHFSVYRQDQKKFAKTTKKYFDQLVFCYGKVNVLAIHLLTLKVLVTTLDALGHLETG